MSHRVKTLCLYRSLLRECGKLPHEYLRQFHCLRVKDAFRKDASLNNSRAPDAFKKHSKELRRLQRANQGDLHAIQRVIELAYGRRGRLKRELIESLKSDPSTPPREALIPSNPNRSRPPKIPESLVTLFAFPHARHVGKPLLSSQLSKPPTLPSRADPQSEEARLLGPFSLRRTVNIHWRHLTDEMRRLYPPLNVQVMQGRTKRERLSDAEPLISSGVQGTGLENTSISDVLEHLATPGPATLPRRQRQIADHSSSAGSSQANQSLLHRPPSLQKRSSRFLRRRYQELLAQTPVLTYELAGSKQLTISSPPDTSSVPRDAIQLSPPELRSTPPTPSSILPTPSASTPSIPNRSPGKYSVSISENALFRAALRLSSNRTAAMSVSHEEWVDKAEQSKGRLETISPKSARKPTNG